MRKNNVENNSYILLVDVENKNIDWIEKKVINLNYSLYITN
jgi:hypothetical protein